MRCEYREVKRGMSNLSTMLTSKPFYHCRNLFLGYYVPYRHAIPLWEMENDYYLHNFHVRTGLGTSQSMREFQMAFGVLDWNGEEFERDTDIGTDKSSVVSSNHSQRRSHQRMHSRSTTTGSMEGVFSRQADQSRRIEMVRKRCKLQNKALSIWWKVALQANVQQRMWMQLGSSPMESLMPPRFDRLYQPEKMAQFDRFFARPWATPVRRSHSLQHNSGSDDENEVGVVRRNVSGHWRHNAESDTPLDGKRDYEDSSTSLENFVEEYGFGPQTRPILKTYLQHLEPSLSKNVKRKESVHKYIGDLEKELGDPPEEYVKHASSQSDFFDSSPFRSQAYDEFKKALEPLSLSANDVDGIRKVRNESLRVFFVLHSSHTPPAR